MGVHISHLPDYKFPEGNQCAVSSPIENAKDLLVIVAKKINPLCLPRENKSH